MRLICRVLASGVAPLALAAAPLRHAAAQTALPAATAEGTLFDGAAYQRVVEAGAAPLVAHIVRLDLTKQNMRLTVTPADRAAGGEHRATMTSEQVRGGKALLAVNGGYFLPFAGGSPGGDDYYPHVGDMVNVSGAAIAGGAVVSPVETGLDIRVNAIVCFRDLVVEIADGQTCPQGFTDGLAAGPRLLEGGAARSFYAFDNAYAMAPAPRTAIGLSADGKTAWLVVVDGRQQGYSAGASLPQLATLFKTLGAADALNLDGGGSSTLAIAGAGGKPIILNRPIHTGVPGRERPVANQILLVGK